MRTLTLPPSISRRMLVIAFVAITLALLGGGCWIYRAQVQAIRQGSCETIASIATMKEVQIAQWRKGLRGAPGLLQRLARSIEGFDIRILNHRRTAMEGDALML